MTAGLGLAALVIAAATATFVLIIMTGLLSRLGFRFFFLLTSASIGESTAPADP